MKNDNNLELLDVLNIISFVIGIVNYQENLTQSDKQDLMGEVDNKTQLLLEEIHEHLAKQDAILDDIRRIVDETNQKVSPSDG